jgi:adenine-specific DNA-methyltransferase
MNIHSTTYEILKDHYDNTLNKDKANFKTSNDEPTPIGCVEEMLSKIPEELWKKDNLKILDPCGGNGNFHFVNHNLIQKYNPERTTEEIIRDNLYYNDINDIRIGIVKSIFDNENIQLNMTSVDFLQYPEIENEEDRFDLSTVNPPYARLIFDETTQKFKRASKNHNLIKPFIKKCLSLTKEGGYICFITPNNWMSLADRNTLIKELTQYQFHWLDIGSAKKKWFSKVGSSFTWYIIQKTPATKPFTISGNYRGLIYESQVDPQQRDYIPLIYNRTIQSILNKVIDMDNEKYKVETSSDLHKYTKRDLITKEKDDEHSFKLIHTPKQTVYASRSHKFQDGYKVFISTTDTYGTFVDNCGMTQSIAFIRCKSEEEANHISDALSNNLFRFINNICRWGNFNCVRILQRFPVVKNKDNIYNEFNITKEEQEFINNVIDNYSVKPRKKKNKN